MFKYIKTLWCAPILVLSSCNLNVICELYSVVTLLESRYLSCSLQTLNTWHWSGLDTIQCHKLKFISFRLGQESLRASRAWWDISLQPYRSMASRFLSLAPMCCSEISVRLEHWPMLRTWRSARVLQILLIPSSLILHATRERDRRLNSPLAMWTRDLRKIKY